MRYGEQLTETLTGQRAHEHRMVRYPFGIHLENGHTTHDDDDDDHDDDPLLRITHSLSHSFAGSHSLYLTKI